MPKLTKAERAEAVKLYAAGMSKAAIARKYNVTQPAIAKLLNGVAGFRQTKPNETDGEDKTKKQKKPIKVDINQDNAKIAKVIINKAMASLEDSIEKASAKDQIHVIERLMFIYGRDNGQESALDRLCATLDKIVEGKE